MVTVLAGVAVAAVLFGAAVLATRDDPLLAPAPRDLPDVALPDGPLRPADVEALRLSTAVRGYRMREVDAVLARLSRELAERDRRLAELTGPGEDEVCPPPSS